MSPLNPCSTWKSTRGCNKTFRNKIQLACESTSGVLSCMSVPCCFSESLSARCHRSLFASHRPWGNSWVTLPSGYRTIRRRACQTWADWPGQLKFLADVSVKSTTLGTSIVYPYCLVPVVAHQHLPWAYSSHSSSGWGYSGSSPLTIPAASCFCWTSLLESQKLVLPCKANLKAHAESGCISQHALLPVGHLTVWEQASRVA